MGHNVHYKVFSPNDINYLLVSEFKLLNSISIV